MDSSAAEATPVHPSENPSKVEIRTPKSTRTFDASKLFNIEQQPMTPPETPQDIPTPLDGRDHAYGGSPESESSGSPTITQRPRHKRPSLQSSWVLPTSASAQDAILGATPISANSHLNLPTPFSTSNIETREYRWIRQTVPPYANLPAVRMANNNSGLPEAGEMLDCAFNEDIISCLTELGDPRINEGITVVCGKYKEDKRLMRGMEGRIKDLERSQEVQTMSGGYLLNSIKVLFERDVNRERDLNDTKHMLDQLRKAEEAKIKEIKAAKGLIARERMAHSKERMARNKIAEDLSNDNAVLRQAQEILGQEVNDLKIRWVERDNTHKIELEEKEQAHKAELQEVSGKLHTSLHNQRATHCIIHALLLGMLLFFLFGSESGTPTICEGIRMRWVMDGFSRYGDGAASSRKEIGPRT
ncbi:hypothetical protein TWF718_009686 [Orbilia javanica]|uniref:Uncharacterized protein n=1 Tax=Orbilia javanica TaxID=47235 RepID=A0AAN8RLL7_9PEZI